MKIGRDFGQYEPLTRRLHNLVRSYPKGLGVLKEFIQNADDAEADEIVFFIDELKYDVDGLPQTMHWLHNTPALLIYNNKPFSDKDIKGIQNIGESGKSDSVGKAGRFGLGFNACYNVTDVPYFFTRDVLYFFDPHYQTVPDASLESPGRCFGVKELIDAGWPILDGFFRFIGNADGFTGTVFRLPFRTTEQSSTSQIKHDPYTVADALDAVQELQEMGSAMLLFLKHVRRLKVERQSQDGVIETLLSIQATNSQEIAESRSKVNALLNRSDPQEILAHLSENGDIFSSCRHEYSVGFNGRSRVETWRIVDGFFTGLDEDVIEACRNMIDIGEKALPYAGAAWPLDSERRPDGRLFCFLPVPIQTRLPAQINGYFDLDDSRQNMFLDWSARGKARMRVDWNRMLLEKSVSQAYVRLLEDLRSDIGTDRIDSYYSAFPKAEDNEEIWENWLTSTFYLLASRTPLFRCSGEITWCVIEETRSLPEGLSTVGNELIAENFLPIPNPALPPHVQEGFRPNNIEVPVLRPYDLRSQLKEQHDVDCTLPMAPRACLRKREHIREILRFCLSDGPEKDIWGLPLIIDCRGHLRTVGLTDDPLYISTNALDQKVFLDHPEWLVDPAFANEVNLPMSMDANLIEMGNEFFVCKLSEYVAEFTGDGEPKLNKARSGPLTDSWLKSVFSRLLDSDLNEMEPDLNEIPLIPDQSRILHAMGRSSTPLLFSGSRELKRALKDLSVPVVSGISKELLKLLYEFSEKHDCIWPIKPRDLIDTLAEVCIDELQQYDKFTDVQFALLQYLSKDDSLKSLAQLTDRQEKLKSLKLFPTTKRKLVTLDETAYVPQDFEFPPCNFGVLLLHDGQKHEWRWLYDLLKVPELSRSR